MTGLAKEEAVRNFVITAGLHWLLVVELLGGQSTVAIVGTPAGSALAGSARTLTRKALHRLGKRHEVLLRVSFFAPGRTDE
jgi:hypothetical protein